MLGRDDESSLSNTSSGTPPVTPRGRSRQVYSGRATPTRLNTPPLVFSQSDTLSETQEAQVKSRLHPLLSEATVTTAQSSLLEHWNFSSQPEISVLSQEWNLSDFFDYAFGFLLPSNMSNPQNPQNPLPQNVTINNYKVEFRDRDRFNGQHFDIWMIRVKSILQELQLWDIVTGTEVKPAPNAAADVLQAWNLKDLKARNVIQSALDLTMMTHAQEAASSQSIWDLLCQCYQKKSVTSLVSATREFYNCRMRDFDTIEAHIARF